MLTTMFGDDRNAPVLLKTLMKYGNLAINTKRYESLIKKYGSEEKFLKKLKKECGHEYRIRLAKPFSINKSNNENNNEFYVIEENNQKITRK